MLSGLRASTSSAPTEAHEAARPETHQDATTSGAATAVDPPPHIVQRQQLLERGVLLQPLPVGSVLNNSLHHAVVELNGNYFLDPERTLESTMRVLQVVKQVG